ncbi:MAG: TonB-dependent receptor [Saprospiraceae bacterium]|nr:MAG: TonB-dependent receptor [Saprospiraceae bacterium]
MPGIQLSYSNEWIPADQYFTYQFDSIALNTVLHILLRKTELTYAEAGDYIVIRPTPGELPPPLRFTISGFVEDGQSGERLIGVNIYQPGTGRGTTTNENGFFSLSLAADSVNLIFSYVGYSQHLEQLGLFGNSQIKIALQPSGMLSTVEVKASPSVAALPQIEGPNQQPRFTAALIEEMPGLLGEPDALQALDLLPGVQAGTASLGSVNVRGGDNGHNLILLDGAQVYNPNHLLGVYSVFNGSAVKDVELIKGAIPAQYGGRLSSVIAVNGREGNFNQFKAEGSLGLIAVKLMVEGPIKKGKSSFLLAGRRSIWDLIASPIIKAASSYPLEVGYHFGDINLKYKHKVSNRDDWSLSVYLGQDRFKYFEDFTDQPYDTVFITPDSFAVYENAEQLNVNLGWRNQLAALNWNHVWNDRLFSNASIAFSSYRFDLFVESVQKGITETGYKDNFSKAVYYSGVTDVSMRLDFDWNWRHNLRLRYGGKLIWHHYEPQSSGNGLFVLTDSRIGTAIPGGLELDLTPLSLHAFENGLYSEASWDVNNKWQIHAGLHLAVFNSQDDWFSSLQPRLRTSFQLANSQRVYGSVIYNQQYAHLLTNNNFNLPTDLWVPASDVVRPESSWQMALGWEQKWGEKKYQFSIEGYYHRFRNLVTYSPYFSSFESTNWEQNLVQGRGKSHGWECLLRKDKGTITGLLSYHLSWSERQFPVYNQGRWFPHRNSHRHEFAVMANIKLGPKVKLSLGWHYASGNFITVSNQQIAVAHNDHGTWDYNVVRDYSTVNNVQTPDYHRLDINFNFTKKRETYERKWSLGLFNAYNQKNPTIYNEYNFINQGQSVEGITIFTVIPSVNYQIKF